MKPIPEPNVYLAWNHTGWGDRIGIMDWDAGRIEGHLARKPRIGDRIQFRMQSGKVLETRVTEVDYPLDPPDQFFATVEKLGYLA